MNSRLDSVKNWERLAKECRFSATGIAARCGISVRQLERFFNGKFRKGPHEWLHSARMSSAIKMLSDGYLIKEIADKLGDKDAAHFSRDFRKQHGLAPGQWRSKHSDD